MAEEIFGFMGGFDVSSLFIYLIWFFVFLVFAGCVTAMVIMLMIKKRQKKVIEVNMVNRRMRIFNGRIKKKSKGVRQFYSSKLKRFLPKFQQKSTYLKGRQDTVILLKDNNGMYHTARVPNYKQIKKWYKVVHGIDIANSKELDHQKLRDIYLLPSPHEDLDWLSGQCVEAEKEFQSDHWWSHPNVMVIGTGFICFLMIVVTIILEKKM